MFDEGLLPDHAPNQPIVAVSDPEALRSDWDTLFTLLEIKGLRDNPEAVHLLEGMLLRLRSRRDASAERVDHEVLGLAERIRASPGQDWDWETEAARYAVSLVHLRRRFREVLGVPPHQFLLQTRMEVASRLLLSSDLAAKAVGAAVGVPDPYYFSKLFKAHFHLPPDHYRREADPHHKGTATPPVENEV
jgi:AraC-like DNA-binding protein